MKKDNTKMKKITVFTPTYNRAYILHNLYHSLQRQTNKDFEWIIVDDGSIDNTNELVNEWILENNDFNIRYYKKENGGKCRAINYALDLAQGELFFTVDSDDYLTDDAIEKIIEWEITLENKKAYCGIAGNLGYSRNETPNSLFKDDYYDGTLFDRYKNIDGERAIVFYTDIHKRYKYPEFEGEKFMTEAIVYNRIANDGYRMRFYNDIIWIYEYREDGLTKAGSELFINNPKGYGLWLKEKAIFQKYNILKKLRMHYTFTCDLSSKYDTNKIAECIGTSKVLIYLLNKIHILKEKLKEKGR